MLTIVEVPEGNASMGKGGVPWNTIDKPGTPPKYCIIVKGAPNIILGKCSKQALKNGMTEDFTDISNSRAMEVVDDLSSQALRVLAIAVKPV